MQKVKMTKCYIPIDLKVSVYSQLGEMPPMNTPTCFIQGDGKFVTDVVIKNDYFLSVIGYTHFLKEHEGIVLDKLQLTELLQDFAKKQMGHNTHPVIVEDYINSIIENET